MVASEVKELASQTANATEGISEQVKSIQDAIKESVVDIQAVTTTIHEINGITASTASAVANNMNGVSLAASETGQASSEVLIAVDGLIQELASLDHEVKSFLNNIRSYE